MNEKIGDARLEEIQGCLIDFLSIAGERLDPHLTDDEIYWMATELLALRSLNARLMEDGERAHKYALGHIYQHRQFIGQATCYCGAGYMEKHTEECEYGKYLDQHTALMKEIGG